MSVTATDRRFPTTTVPVDARAGAIGLLAIVIRSGIATLAGWASAAATRRRLHALGDRQLRDIGLDRADLGPEPPAPHFGDLPSLERRRLM